MTDIKRDEKGLIPANAKDTTQKESDQRAKYTKTLTRLHLFIAPTIAFVVYALMSKFIPGQAELFKQKFEFINKYQLQYMYFAFYIFMIPRIYAMINSNATRAPCRLDRPDQHIYKIQAKKTNKQFADAPYVLMDNEGVNGVFNRAQRAAFWLDENLTQMCCLCILTAPVFGPVILILSLLHAYGAIKFVQLYTSEFNARRKVLIMALLPMFIMFGMVSVIAIKSTLPQMFSFLD